MRRSALIVFVYRKFDTMERKAIRGHIAESTTLQSTARTAKIFSPKIHQLGRNREWISA
jgi:hypothetical protein